MSGNTGSAAGSSTLRNTQIVWIPSEQERHWGMLAHFLALASSALFGMSFIGPLAVYLIKRHESPFIAHHAKEALNFHLSLLVYMVAAVALTWLVSDYLAILAVAVPVFGVVATVRAGLQAHRGELSQYPLCLRFIP